MNTNEFVTQGPKVQSKKEAMSLIANLLSDITVPTFGFPNEEGYPIRPMDEYADDYSGEDGKEIARIQTEYETALRLAAVLATKWEIPFDPEMFKMTMGVMREDQNGLWNSSQIGC